MQHHVDVRPDDIQLGDRAAGYFRIALSVAAIGALGTVWAWLSSDHPEETFFHAYLVNFTWVLTLALGALFFIIITHLTRAGWSIVVRRIAEVLTVPFPVLALLAVPIIFGMHHLYEWTHLDVVEADPILKGKQPYLNSTFFIARIIGYFVIWTLLAWRFRKLSIEQDTSKDPQLTNRMGKLSAGGTLLFALTVTFAAFDLLMSLYPHWYSTIYGVYFFAGCVVAFFALCSLIVMALHRVGKLNNIVTVEHFHDLGKLMFAFTVFWAYVAFSQYMLMWYGNLPEETLWYEVRQTGFWRSWSVLLLLGHFLAPFLFIMSRYQKRRVPMLAAAAIWMLAMHWVDLYYLAMPGHRPETNPFVLADFTLFLLLGGLFAALTFRNLGKVALIPTGDPRLPESLSFENV